MSGQSRTRRPALPGACGFFVLALFLPTVAFSIDLLTVYRAALENDPTFAAERYSLEASRERIPQARSALLPALGASGNIGRTGGDVTYTGVPSVDRTFNTLGWTFQLTLPLVRAEGLVAYRQSHAEFSQAAANFKLARQDLILRVAKAYFDVLVSEENLSAADAEVRAVAEQQVAARRSFESGVSSVTDVDEAASRAELAKAQQLSAETDIQVKQAELERVTGVLPQPLAGLRPEANVLLPDPIDVGQWIAQATDSNLGVVGLRSAVEGARLEVEKARVARLPVIEATASYGRNYSSGNNTNPDDYGTNAHIRQGGIQFSMPIADGGAIHARIGEASAKEHKIEADLEAARRQAAVDARSAYFGVVNGIAQLKALRAAIDASVSAVTGAQAGYRLGLKINSDVLDAQRQRYTAERDLAKARYETVLQGLKLKAAAGTLEESDLSSVNAMLMDEKVP